MILLDEQQIKTELNTQGFTTPYKLYLFKTIDSTNRYLKDLPSSDRLTLCCAEEQTQGRGRFNRHWHSPFGENIYCSSRWNLHCDLTKLSGLSLVTSLAVLATLNELTPCEDIKVKWPNDILWGDKKLCGSLIELATQTDGNIQVIIGIGLNVNSDTKNYPLPDKPWCSLYEIHQQLLNRNQLISSLIIRMESYLNRFINKGLNDFMDEWKQADYLAGKHITMTQMSGLICGKACGITSMGQLILEDEQGTPYFISSGDASLHF